MLMERAEPNPPMPNIEEILALDLQTLREHTELAGDILDPNVHRNLLALSLITSEVIYVRRHGSLVAYAMLKPQEDDRWFVSGFGTHPDHRDATVFRELFAKLSLLVQRRSIGSLRSNVYKTNRLSMVFHKRLGFRVSRENSKAVEFTATVDELSSASRAVRQVATRPG